MRIIGEELADRYGLRAAVASALPGPPPCIICGAPASICKHEKGTTTVANEKDTKEPKDQSAALQREQVEQAKTGGPPSEDQGIVVADGKTSGIPTSAGPAVDEIVVLDKDVYAEFTPKNAKRPSHILLFHKGQQVRRSELERVTASYDNSAAHEGE